MERLRELLEKLSWLHVALGVGLAVAFGYFTLDPSAVTEREMTLAQAKAEVGTTERKINEAKQFQEQYAEKRKQYVALVDELTKVQGALPKQFFLPDLLSDLLREAKQLEIEITAITPDASEEPGELYNSLGFNIDAKGTFLQFFLFLDRLANMKRFVSIHRFSLQKDGERPAVALAGADGPFGLSKLEGGRDVYPGITANFRVITYRYRTPPSPEAAASATAAKGGKP